MDVHVAMHQNTIIKYKSARTILLNRPKPSEGVLRNIIIGFNILIYNYYKSNQLTQIIINYIQLKKYQKFFIEALSLRQIPHPKLRV